MFLLIFLLFIHNSLYKIFQFTGHVNVQNKCHKVIYNKGDIAFLEGEKREYGGIPPDTNYSALDRDEQSVR